MGDTAIKQFPLVKGLKTATEKPFEALLARGWEPKLEVTGASGIPEVATAGNVLRTQTTFKLSIRLPPTFNGD